MLMVKPVVDFDVHQGGLVVVPDCENVILYVASGSALANVTVAVVAATNAASPDIGAFGWLYSMLTGAPALNAT